MMRLDDIRHSRKLKKYFREAFEQELEACGEMLIGKVSTDYILDIFEQQGYWSGTLYRISFNPEFGFEYESRW